jgi:hypothetical protein
MRKIYVHVLIHTPFSSQGNFGDKHRNTTQPHILEQYTTYLCYLNKIVRIVRQLWHMSRMDVNKIVFLFFLDLSVLITFLLHKSSGENYSCRWCVLRLIDKLIEDEDMPATRVMRGGSSWPVQKHGNTFTGLSEEPGGSVRGVASHFTCLCVLRTIALCLCVLRTVAQNKLL